MGDRHDIPIRSAWLFEQDTTGNAGGQVSMHIDLAPEPSGFTEEIHRVLSRLGREVDPRIEIHIKQRNPSFRLELCQLIQKNSA